MVLKLECLKSHATIVILQRGAWASENRISSPGLPHISLCPPASDGLHRLLRIPLHQHTHSSPQCHHFVEGSWLKVRGSKITSNLYTFPWGIVGGWNLKESTSICYKKIGENYLHTQDSCLVANNCTDWSLYERNVDIWEITSPSIQVSWKLFRQ